MTGPPPRVRPAGRSPFGPLLWWELVRLARRGDATRARVLLLYSLLAAVVGFAVVWSFWSDPNDPLRLLRATVGPFPVAEARGLACTFIERLTLVLLEAQLLLVAAIAPAYAAATVSEEKDRQTLALLLTTELTDREIVWGKAAARVVFLFATVAAALPVFLLTLLFGGIDAGLLAAGYALTAGTAVLSAAIGVSAACRAPDSRAALVRAYALWAAIVACVVVPPCVLLSPFAMLIHYLENPESPVRQAACAFAYPAGQVLLGLALVADAARQLRRAGPGVPPYVPSAYPEPPRGRVVLSPFESDRPPPALPPVSETDPVLWKERHGGRSLVAPALDRPARALRAAFTVVTGVLFAVGGFTLLQRAVRSLDPIEAERMLRRGTPPPDPAGSILVAAGVLASGLYLVPLAVGVCGCVAGERFRGTLDSLLTTALRRRHILRSKVRAHAERGLAFAGVAGVALGAGFGADGGTWFGAVALAAFAGGVGLVVASAALLTVRCATPVRAFRLSLPAVLAVVGLPVLVWNLTDWDAPARAARVFAWSAGAFVVGAAVLWWRAERELERG